MHICERVASKRPFRLLLRLQTNQMKTLKATVRKIINDLPFVNAQKRHHPIEYALLKGKDIATTTHPSILHFSLNKSATQYTKRVLNEAAESVGLVNAHLNGYAFHSDFPYLDDLSAVEMAQYQYLFKSKGYLYSVFGGMIENIPNLSDFLVVWMIRDPRDILVSSYYSTAYSHPTPGKRSNKTADFQTKRQTAQQLSIDDFVLQESEALRQVYQRYIDLLLPHHPNCYITKYEEMVADHEQWLSDLLAYCQLSISDELKAKLVAQNKRMKPKGEDKNAHMRKGVAGDFREKLQDETIEKLNVRFGAVLGRFGYEE